ncbi:hypothetical protein [uncultured Rikenella sp.]|uniref:hypothetical protein n=2 Tax=uncultured Rikenella sp. TaxID=368003 RepID=UPI002628BFC2|nr:hypothetical protein [uncultured Rikenella sp.]
MPLGINGRENPAPGFRNAGSGAPNSVGNHGFNYSSGTKSNSGLDLNFSATGLYPDATGNRGFGLQLRCLSE